MNGKSHSAASCERKRNEKQVMLVENGVEKMTYVYRRNAINSYLEREKKREMIGGTEQAAAPEYIALGYEVTFF